MLVDIHLHSGFSFDSCEKISNYLEKARELGVPVIGFSEHYDYDAVLDGADIALCDIPKYVGYLNGVRAENVSPEILCGIEFGYRDVCVEHYRRLIEDYDFDYVINSVHTLPVRGDCFQESFFAGRTIQESYREYFKAVLESVKADFDFQIVGHLGYASRYRNCDNAKINYADYSDILDEILECIIVRDKCLEINAYVGKTEGLCLPDTDIILRYLQLGGKKLSFGSDSHKAGDYLRKSTAIIEFLKSAGVDEMFYYKKRRPIAYKI
ncbi:MAG: histidinol-phosphatase HisJ family protein [Clostridia bacterium]|nr:histidinol-phosphatase HisJ family protein [Clostridia bacterium]